MLVPRRRPRGQHGAAVVDFVLVLFVLIPLVLGIIQLGLVLYVRSTLASAASEGARYGATLGNGPTDAVARTRSQLAGVLAGDFAVDVTSGFVAGGGTQMVEVRVRARVPALGIGGPAVTLEVSGHGVVEAQ